MKKTAVIVAAGSGMRMGSELPKQFHIINGQAVLWHSIRAFIQAYDDIGIVLVLPVAHLGFAQRIISTFAPQPIQVTAGGASRFESVKNGLALVDPTALVLVHDAARCLVTPGLIRRCAEAAILKGNAVPVTESSDSLRLVTGESNDPISRDRVRQVQTPQVFPADVLKRAFSQPYHPGFTDEATVVAGLGLPIHLVPGERENLKITQPIDLEIAKLILSKREGG